MKSTASLKELLNSENIWCKVFLSGHQSLQIFFNSFPYKCQNRYFPIDFQFNKFHCHQGNDPPIATIFQLLKTVPQFLRNKNDENSA